MPAKLSFASFVQALTACIDALTGTIRLTLAVFRSKVSFFVGYDSILNNPETARKYVCAYEPSAATWTPAAIQKEILESFEWVEIPAGTMGLRIRDERRDGISVPIALVCADPEHFRLEDVEETSPVPAMSIAEARAASRGFKPTVSKKKK